MENRFKRAREERGLTAVKLAEMLDIDASTINNWESGRRQVAADKLLRMADVLGFSVDYLLGRDYYPLSQTEPVLKESLPALHGQPVWSASHGWMLVNAVKSSFIMHDLSFVAFGDVQDEIYIIPPAFSVSLRGAGKPLSLDEVRSKSGAFWLEPITSDIGLASELRGWYRIHDGRLVANEFGARFYLDTYGVKWLAFDEPN